MPGEDMTLKGSLISRAATNQGGLESVVFQGDDDQQARADGSAPETFSRLREAIEQAWKWRRNPRLLTFVS